MKTVILVGLYLLSYADAARSWCQLHEPHVQCEKPQPTFDFCLGNIHKQPHIEFPVIVLQTSTEQVPDPENPGETFSVHPASTIDVHSLWKAGGGNHPVKSNGDPLNIEVETFGLEDSDDGFIFSKGLFSEGLTTAWVKFTSHVNNILFNMDGLTVTGASGSVSIETPDVTLHTELIQDCFGASPSKDSTKHPPAHNVTLTFNVTQNTDSYKFHGVKMKMVKSTKCRVGTILTKVAMHYFDSKVFSFVRLKPNEDLNDFCLELDVPKKKVNLEIHIQDGTTQKYHRWNFILKGPKYKKKWCMSQQAQNTPDYDQLVQLSNVWAWKTPLIRAQLKADTSSEKDQPFLFIRKAFVSACRIIP